MSQAREYFTRTDPCPTCKNRRKKFYVSDGLTYCKNCDTLQEVATQTEVLGDDLRSIRQTTRKKKEKVERVSRIFRGASARELFLQAYQLILWKQCNTLIHAMGLPHELEHVVKNLWALRLQLLKDNIDAVSDDENLFSSQPQVDENGPEEKKRPYRRMFEKAMPSLIDSLGLCYLGIVLLRLPIGVGDLHRWVMQEDLLYTRAIRDVPAVIKGKLPAEYIAALDTTSVLQPDEIRDTIENLGRFYSHHFKIALPPLNAPLMLFKLIRALALPVSLFPVVRGLAGLLSIDFSFPRAGKRHLASSFPEASLLSLLIIGVKLHHPFDDLPRSAASFDDPAILQIDWSQWVNAQKNHESMLQAEKHIAPGSEMHITEENVLKMSGEQMDDYLNWYEQTWIDEDRARNKHRPLNEDFRKWFPTAGNDLSSTQKHAEQISRESLLVEQFSMTVMRTMQLRNVVTEAGPRGSSSEIMPIGSFYKRYRAREDMPSHAVIFHQVAADTTGMSFETLLRSIFSLEEKLMDQRVKGPRRRGRPPGYRKSNLGGFDIDSVIVKDMEPE